MPLATLLTTTQNSQIKVAKPVSYWQCWAMHNIAAHNVRSALDKVTRSQLLQWNDWSTQYIRLSENIYNFPYDVKTRKLGITERQPAELIHGSGLARPILPAKIAVRKVQLHCNSDASASADTSSPSSANVSNWQTSRTCSISKSKGIWIPSPNRAVFWMSWGQPKPIPFWKRSTMSWSKCRRRLSRSRGS